MNTPVFSRRDVVPFTPEGSPRSYTVAPLTFRERQNFRADLAREGGVYPRHALRGWDGPGLPPFQRVRGGVPAELLDLLPDDEIEAIGWKANELMQVAPSAEGNSAAPSPSSASPAPSTEG